MIKIAFSVMLFIIAGIIIWMQLPKLSNTRSVCFENLHIIQSAKESWRYDNDKQYDDTPSWEDIKPYFPDGMPICPQGGIYTIGKVDEPPKCSINNKNHQLTSEMIKYVKQKGMLNDKSKPAAKAGT